MDVPLNEACISNNLRKVQEIVEESPEDVFKEDADGRVPLHWAVSFQYEEIVIYLLSRMKEANIDELADNSGWTPFHIACSVGNFNILSLLYDRVLRPNLDLATNQGVTALHLAVAKKHINVCKFLLDHGASVRSKDKKLQLPIHRAAAVGSLALVDLLCGANSPVNSVDFQGWSPLFHALAEGNADVAVLLVNKFYADDQLTDPNGYKPVDVALNEQVKKHFIENLE